MENHPCQGADPRASKARATGFLAPKPGPTLSVPPCSASFEIPIGAIAASAENRLPLPSSLIALAIEAFESGRADDPWTLEPVYLRRSAAEDKRDGAIAAS